MAANTTLTTKEVHALRQLLDIAMRGGDSRIVARNPAARSAYAKIVRLETRRMSDRSHLRVAGGQP